jgi:hypothetical protein
MIVYQNRGVGLIALGVFAILAWAVFRVLWIIGILLIIAGLIWMLVGKK